MNTVMRTLGGALGGQIVATFLANDVVHGLPTISAFTTSFALEAVFLCAATATGFLIPGRRYGSHAPAFERELVPAQEAR
jgi:hypothetical protein